jgi:hypothetical protein
MDDASSGRPSITDSVSPTFLIVTLVGLRIVVLGIALVRFSSAPIDEPTLVRFQEIAQEEGRPWRDFADEYPPGQTLVVRSADRDSLAVLAQEIADLATAWLLALGWGRSTAIRYLVLGLPLVVFIYMRLDLISVCLATAAALLLRRDRDRASGVVFGAAVLFRLWPVVVFPILLIRRRARAALWAVGALAIGGAAWVLWGGVDAIRQVVTFRGATGWGIGSTVGSVLWAAGRPIVFEAGAYRVGTVGGARFILIATLAVLLVAIWVRAARTGSDPAGRPALSAVAALLFCSPLLSDSYVSWLLPWAAVAASEDRWASRAVFAVCLAQAVPYLVSGHLPVAGSQVLDLLRIPLLGFVVVAWFLNPAPRRAEERKDVDRVATPRS